MNKFAKNEWNYSALTFIRIELIWLACNTLHLKQLIKIVYEH